jgi:hypothetical protein
MGWTNPSTAPFAVGYVVKNADITTYLTNNMLETAPAKVTTKGDIVAATGGNAITRVPVGANGACLVGDDTQPAGLKYDWRFRDVVGFQRAIQSGSATGSATGETSVNFPVAFTAQPQVVATATSGSRSVAVQVSNININGFQFSVYDAANGRTTDTINWIAVGQIGA